MDYLSTFKDKSDEDLIKIKNKCSPTSEDHIQADIELHKRKINRENESYAVQDSTKKLTFIILIITILSFIVIIYQCEKPIVFPFKSSNVIHQSNDTPHNNGISQKK